MRDLGALSVPWGLATSVTYSYGSGNRYNASISATPYGKTGTNRLNLTNAGGTDAATIVIPADVADRWDGPAVITSGDGDSAQRAAGLPLHKVDLRVTEDLRLRRTREGRR